MTSRMTAAIPAELKLTTLPRALRPRCGALRRDGKPCCAQALKTGFCAVHSGLPADAVSPEGRENQRLNGQRVMRHLWETRWKEGRPLSDEGRARIVAAQKRRSAESRSPSEETREKISASRRLRSHAGNVFTG